MGTSIDCLPQIDRQPSRSAGILKRTTTYSEGMFGRSFVVEFSVYLNIDNDMAMASTKKILIPAYLPTLSIERGKVSCEEDESLRPRQEDWTSIFFEVILLFLTLFCCC
mmetsp:Transcript_47295/g.115471  ORF Transcript_47295/g.115471 Transcript_47295/m.115471 type:complete len:109 (+) Transcript_47295:470-796(+)